MMVCHYGSLRVYTVFRVRSILRVSVGHFGCVLVSRSTERAEDVSGRQEETGRCRKRLFGGHHRLLGSVVVVVVVFRRVPVLSFAPDKQFFKLLQMLHYRDSTRVSKDILVLLLLFLLLCPTPYFSPSLDFHFVCMVFTYFTLF